MIRVPLHEEYCTHFLRMIEGLLTRARAIALALSAGELIGLVVHALGQVHGERALGAGNALVGRGAGVDQRQLDVVQRGGAGSRLKVGRQNRFLYCECGRVRRHQAR